MDPGPRVPAREKANAMIKQMMLVGTLVGALGALPLAQAPAASQDAAKKSTAQDAAKKPASAGAAKGAESQEAAKKPPRKSGQGSRMAQGKMTAGHEAPKPQPETAPTPSAPTGEMTLGSVHIPKSVKADGKPLPAGTYQVRLTAQQATPPAKGETPTLERWVEFSQGGKVKGREVVTIVPQGEIDKVQKDTPPHAGGSKVETLKGGDYVRVWINKGGNHFLLHLVAV